MTAVDVLVYTNSAILAAIIAREKSRTSASNRKSLISLSSWSRLMLLAHAL